MASKYSTRRKSPLNKITASRKVKEAVAKPSRTQRPHEPGHQLCQGWKPASTVHSLAPKDGWYAHGCARVRKQSKTFASARINCVRQSQQRCLHKHHTYTSDFIAPKHSNHTKRNHLGIKVICNFCSVPQTIVAELWPKRSIVQPRDAQSVVSLPNRATRDKNKLCNFYTSSSWMTRTKFLQWTKIAFESYQCVLHACRLQRKQTRNCAYQAAKLNYK